MLNKLLNKETINVVDSVLDWKEAIEIAGIPLIKSNIIRDEYIEAIYKTHEEFGPYYVLAPGIAMPHARPEMGSNGIGLSLLIVKNGVSFESSENDPVFIVIMLAAKDSESHIDVISALSELLDVEEDLKVLKSGNIEDIINVIKKY